MVQTSRFTPLSNGQSQQGWELATPTPVVWEFSVSAQKDQCICQRTQCLLLGTFWKSSQQGNTRLVSLGRRNFAVHVPYRILSCAEGWPRNLSSIQLFDVGAPPCTLYLYTLQKMTALMAGRVQNCSEMWPVWIMKFEGPFEDYGQLGWGNRLLQISPMYISL